MPRLEKHRAIRGAWGALWLLIGVLLPVPVLAGAFDQGVAAYERGDYPVARRCWEEAIAAGDWDGARSLGHLYRRGLGVDQDFGRAAAYYQQAFAHGVVNAGLNLAELALAGQGMPRDEAKAKAILAEATERGSELAAFRLRDIGAAEVPDRMASTVGPSSVPSTAPGIDNQVGDGSVPSVPSPEARRRLASYRSSNDASRGWDHFKRPGLSPVVEEAELPGIGHVYRLFAVGAEGVLADLCRDLRANGERCLKK